MRHRPAACAIAAVVVDLVLAGAAGAQPVVLRPSLPAPIILRLVRPPSPTFTTYVVGEFLRVSVPSNWRELPGLNAVTFAPEGAYGDLDRNSVFTHGVGLGLARNDAGDLQVTTSDLITSHVLASGRPHRPLEFGAVSLGDRPGLHTAFWTRSEVTGEPERVHVFSTLVADGTVFYLRAVSPRVSALDYADTFERVVDSITFLDRTGHP